MEKRKFNRRGGIQKQRQSLAYKLNCEITIATSLCAGKPAPDRNTERKKEVASILRRNMRAAGSLVQALKTSKPMPHRKHDTRLVDYLLYQTETLLNTCERYVCPLLEQTDNNKNSRA
nr:MAG TPA: hypothetical protein [Caudoviricetes sp.]